MALTIGVAALFFGVVFIIVGYKGGGPNSMNQNLVGMMKGQYPTNTAAENLAASQAGTQPATAATGGTYAPAPKPAGNNTGAVRGQ